MINLKSLNQFLKYQHFKMEGIHMLRDLFKKGDFLVKLDLKDAYLTIPVWKAHQLFLHFLWKGSLVEFPCLPFGLATAPRMFTKLMKSSLLRQLVIHLIIYLDNILIMAVSKDLLLFHAGATLNLLESLGFIIKYPKSHLVPLRQLEFLGHLVDSENLSLNLPGEKLQKIRKKCRSLLDSQSISIR